jgi:hypothetical protein
VSDAEIKAVRTSCSEADKRRDHNEEAKKTKKQKKNGVVIEESLRCCDVGWGGVGWVGVPLNTD